MSQNKIEILERALIRQKKARKEAEKILEDKSLALFNTTEKLKQANSQLELLIDEKENQLKGVFENINDAYLVMDIQGNILKLNDVAEHFFGFNLSDKPVNVKEFVYKEDSEYAMKSFFELLKKGSFTGYTARIVTKKNKIKWVSINASVIYNQHKKPIAAQGIVRDITQQREEQLVLDLVNNTAKSVLGKEDINEIAWAMSSNIAKFLSTKYCIIYLVNKKTNSLEKIAAFSDKKQKTNRIKDKTVIPLGKGIVGSIAQNGVSEIIGDTTKDSRYIVDDKMRYSEITVPIINDGEVIGVIDAEHKSKNYFTTEHIKTIENIANLVSLQLKSAINLRERNKVEQKNKDLVAELRRSNEELNEYAHIVSHDLKSPLRSIAALTSWIKMDNLEKFDKDSLQNFDNIELTLEKMESLISDVLQFSSIDSDTKQDTLVDIHKLVNDLIKILYVPENVSINILKKLPSIKGDKIKFQQLFQNLIGNAIKFSNKEKALINIDFQELQSSYKFSIQDNGIGIEKRYFDKIFKIFQSLKKSEDSSGIGLSIVKKIVDIYKGEIWLESEINKGTTFYFTIKK